MTETWAVAAALLQFASSAVQIGNVRHLAGRYPEALAIYRGVEPLLGAVARGTELDAAFHNNFGASLYRAGLYDEAEQHYQESLRLRDGSKQVEKSRTMANYAALEMARGRAEHAREILLEATRVLRLHGDAILVKTLASLAAAEISLGDIASAERSLAEARAAAAQHTVNVDESITLDMLACSCDLRRGALDAAGRDCGSAEALSRASYGASNPKYAQIRLMLGELAYRRSQFDDASEHLLAAAHLFAAAAGGQGTFYARALMWLAMVRREQGQIPAATGLADRAALGLEANLAPNNPERVMLANLRADLLRRSGRLAEAEASARQAVAQAETLSYNRQLLPDSLNVLGVVLAAHGHALDEAAQLLERSVSISDPAAQPTALQYLALVRLAQNRPNEAEKAARAAYELRRHLSGPDDPSLAQPLAVWAKALEASGDKRQARTMKQKATELFRRSPQPPTGILSFQDLSH